VLDALERGQSFELRRRGRTIGYLTQVAPAPKAKADWKTHFEWLGHQPKARSKALLEEFEADRRHQRTRRAPLYAI
jgi:hypothetical protein